MELLIVLIVKAFWHIFPEAPAARFLPDIVFVLDTLFLLEVEV
jgi:hypothetical protein